MTEQKKQWVTVELTSHAERLAPDEIEMFLRSQVDEDIDIFVPGSSYRRKDNLVTVWLMEGYAFIEAGKSAGFYFDLEQTNYVSKILTRDERGSRFLLYIGNEEVKSLRERLRKQTVVNVQEGDIVEIDDGIYEGLEGEILVLYEQDQKAEIQFSQLKSIDTIAKIPLTFLRKK